MKDLTAVEHHLVNELAQKGARKADIARKICCDLSTVYRSIHRTNPMGSPSIVRIRKRKTGAYKATPQILQNLLSHVLLYPWHSNTEIIRHGVVPTNQKKSVSRWLKMINIGCYVACKRQGITVINAEKR